MYVHTIVHTTHLAAIYRALSQSYDDIVQWLTQTQALQSAVQRIEGYVRTLEDKVDAKKR
jgi:hypothetical protein